MRITRVRVSTSRWMPPCGNWARLIKQGVSKQGVMTLAWRPGSQYDVAATRGADSVLASDCRAQLGRPSTRRGCCICVTVRLLVWTAQRDNVLANKCEYPLLNVPWETLYPDRCWQHPTIAMRSASLLWTTKTLQPLDARILALVKMI